MDFSVLLGNNTRALASALCTSNTQKQLMYLNSTTPLSMNKSDLHSIHLVGFFH